MKEGLNLINNERERLEALINFNILEKIPESEIDSVVQMAAQICQTQVAILSIFDGKTYQIKASIGLNIYDLRGDFDFCFDLTKNEDYFEIPDAYLDAELVKNPMVIGHPNFRFFGGVPITSVEGFKIGSINIIDPKAKHLNREQIDGAIFPLGDTEKVDIRIEAEKRGLAVAQKPDSHDICFVPSGDNAGWLRDRLGSEVGPIVDQDGTKIGEHNGAYTYTIGQRKGLGLSVAAPDGSPRFVLKIEPVTNTVVVGAREDLAVSSMRGERPIFCGPEVGAAPTRGFVQVRAHGAALDCTYYLDGAHLVAELDEPLLGLATGQAMVIYDGDRVVGSATICETA